MNLIRDLTGEFSALGRTEIASTVCELLQWVRPTCKLKTVECRMFLESLEDAGLVQHPAPTPFPETAGTSDTNHAGAKGVTPDPGGQYRGVSPLCLEPASSADEQALWRTWVEQYHYFGYRIPFGAHLRYFVQITVAGQPVRVGALQCSSPAWRMVAREQWLG